jgi:preprotein translocase subunit YajC
MQNQSDLISSILPLVVLFLIFYFLIIRPQKKQQKERQDMINSLKKGDKIVTSGGLIVEIQKVEEIFLTIEIDANTTAKLSKEYVSNLYENTTK